MSQENRNTAAPRRMAGLRRRPAVPAPAPADVPHLMRYVTDGHPEVAPQDATVADGLRFASITELADAWELHTLLREDLLHAHQRPKVDRYGDVLFLVVRSARYIDEDIDFAEFHMLVRPGAVAVSARTSGGSTAPTAPTSMRRS